MSSQGLTADDIMICGFDGISSGVQAVVDGTISCTVAQDPYNMGYHVRYEPGGRCGRRRTAGVH